MAELAVQIPLSPYVGQDLDQSRKQIRLIKLHPGTANAPLVCSSWVVSLAEKPHYTALSYVWGDPTDQHAITLNHDTTFLITCNLYSALEYLRDKDTARTFWIDAICINQKNEDEKGYQVQLMGPIYRKAEETCLWLGKESADSDLAMRLIGKLDGNDHGSRNNNPDARGLQAIAALQKRPWWSRVWVIQEALLSPKPIVRCGHSTLPFEAFMTLDDIRRGLHRPSGSYLRNPNRLNECSRNISNPFASVLNLWPESRADLFENRDDDGNPHDGKYASRLSYWTQNLDEFDATDPRDKIYGLLGLATDADRDYMGVALAQRMTASEVYTHATRLFITSTRSLAFLSFDVGNRAPCPRGEEGTTMPSWVSDYSNRPLRDDTVSSDGGNQWWRPDYVSFSVPDAFRATGDGAVLSDSIRGDPFPGESMARLVLRGLVVDRIVFVSEFPHYRPYGGIDVEERTRAGLRRWQTTAAKVRTWEQEAMRPGWPDPYQYATGSSLGATRLEAVRRTFLANRYDVGRFLDYHASEPRWDELFDVFLGRREMPPHNKGTHDNSTTPGGQRSEVEALLQYLLPLRIAICSRTAGKSFFITSEGYLGLGPLNSRPGDEVCVLEGGNRPFVLRSVVVDNGEMALQRTVTPRDKQRCFTLVGEAYAHGVSDGEWIADRSEADVVEVVIV